MSYPNHQEGAPSRRYTKDFVDQQLSNVVVQYDRGTGLEAFVPTRMVVRGPSNLRGRDKSQVYKVTKG